MTWVKDRISWWQATLAGRTLTRFGRRRGTVLAGGIAYYAVFSLFPALAVGFTIFGFVVGGSVELQQDLAEAINDAFGMTVIGLTTEDPGIVSMTALTSTPSLSIMGIVSLLLVLWAGLGWLSAMGAGVQVMFGIVPNANLAQKKAFDLVMLVVFGVAILVSVIGSVIATSASEWTARKLGLGDSALASWGTTLVSLLVVVLVNFVIFLLLFKLEARIGLGFGDLWAASLLGALGIFGIQYFAQRIVAIASANEFLAAFASIIGLLLWMNFAGRVVLLAGAWAAEVARDRGHLISAVADDGRPEARQAEELRILAGRAAAAGRPPSPRRAVDGSVPNFGQRSSDRTTIAAGVVLGASVATGLRVAGSAVRSLLPRRT